jgi:hypothetical protein
MAAAEMLKQVVGVGAKAVIVVVALKLLAIIGLRILGFSSVGPRSNSVSARWMRTLAVANGGGVPTGTFFSLLQRLAMTITIRPGGALAVSVMGVIAYFLYCSQRTSPE